MRGIMDSLMLKETYEEFRERIFGTPYLIWHDGPDCSSLGFLRGDEKEQAFVFLLQGLEEGDYVAIQGLSVLDPVRAVPFIRKAYALPQQKLSRLALADFLRRHDPNADIEKLGNDIVATLKQNNLFSIDAVISLKNFPTPSVIEILLLLVEKHEDYLIRYHAANSLLFIAHRPGIESQDELLFLLRSGSTDDSIPEDFIRYKKAADMLRGILAQNKKVAP